MNVKRVGLLLVALGIATGGATAFTPAATSMPLHRTATTEIRMAVQDVVRATAPAYTVSQEQAIEAAQSYIDMGGFSKKGLIKQLSSKYGEGFPLKDAMFAVEHVSVNWYAEAVQSARSYLEMGGFSRNSLIHQLESAYGEQFTHAQALYAVRKVGL